MKPSITTVLRGKTVTITAAQFNDLKARYNKCIKDESTGFDLFGVEVLPYYVEFVIQQMETQFRD